jgi:hypothetical protein
VKELPTAQRRSRSGSILTQLHVAVALDALGRRLGALEIAATPVGYARLLAWATKFGPVERVGVEGTGSCAGASASPTRWTPKQPPVPCRPIPRWVSPRPPTGGWRCCARCGWPVPRRSRLARRPPTSSTPWSSPPLIPCRPGSGSCPWFGSWPGGKLPSGAAAADPSRGHQAGPAVGGTPASAAPGRDRRARPLAAPAGRRGRTAAAGA